AARTGVPGGAAISTPSCIAPLRIPNPDDTTPVDTGHWNWRDARSPVYGCTPLDAVPIEAARYAPGIVRTWPTRNSRGSLSPFATIKRPTLTPNSFAIW